MKSKKKIVKWDCKEANVEIGYSLPAETKLKCLVCMFLAHEILAIVYKWYTDTHHISLCQFIIKWMLSKLSSFGTACIFVHSFQMNCLFTICAYLMRYNNGFVYIHYPFTKLITLIPVLELGKIVLIDMQIAHRIASPFIYTHAHKHTIFKLRIPLV